MKKICTISLVLATALFVVGCNLSESNNKTQSTQQKQIPPSHVDVFVAQKSDIPISFDYTATVVSQQSVIIYPKVGGTIIKQFFKSGDRVRAGDILYKVDPEKYEATFEALQASVGVTEASLKNAQTEFNRISNLYKKNAISQKEYDAATAALDSAKANLVSSKANLKSAKIDLDYTNIVAPFDGILGNNLIDVGSLVVANQTGLVRLTKLNPIDVSFYISDVDNLNRTVLQESGEWVQTNSDAKLKISNQEYIGKVKFIDNVIDTSTGSVLARAEFENKDGKILPGAFGHIIMNGFYQKDGFNIPQVALQQTATKTYVLVVKDGKVEQKDVKITYQTKDMAVISQGLENGDKIIVNNFLKIRLGVPVQVDKEVNNEFDSGKVATLQQEATK
jgi:efflux transporter, RND family, MFP subunit